MSQNQLASEREKVEDATTPNSAQRLSRQEREEIEWLRVSKVGGAT